MLNLLACPKESPNEDCRGKVSSAEESLDESLMFVETDLKNEETDLLVQVVNNEKFRLIRLGMNTLMVIDLRAPIGYRIFESCASRNDAL